MFRLQDRSTGLNLVPLACLALSFLAVAGMTACTVSVGDAAAGQAQGPNQSGPTDGNDDQPGDDQPQGEGNTTVNFAVVTGTVANAAGAPLGGVNVTAGSLTTTSNEQGFFSIDNVPAANRLVVTFETAGYVFTSDVVRTLVGQNAWIDAVMLAEEYAQDIEAAAGGTVATPDGGSVVVPAGGLVDAAGQPYTGTATVSLTTFDPTVDADRDAFPGEFIGVTTEGEAIPIVSYGFMDISPRDPNGGPLELATGSTADIAIPIPAGLQDSAPDTMPLWVYDETDGQWHEEGTMTRDGGVYRGTVTHFSIFNSDVGMNSSYVNGRVMDCITNTPIEGAKVTIKGISPRNCWYSWERTTSVLGEFRNPDDPQSAQFAGIPVDANSVCEIWASKGGAESERREFTSLDTNQVLNYGDICLNVPLIRITLVWGDNPQDLDSHLTIPMDDGTRAHVYYPLSGGAPVGGATLDTDDTDGNGPEITTVYVSEDGFLNDGVYRYSVHHFRGAETISTSQASVSMIIDGLGIYNLTPPAGALGDNDAWRLWEITVENGAVTDVNAVNQYFNDVDDSDMTVFRSRD